MWSLRNPGWQVLWEMKSAYESGVKGKGILKSKLVLPCLPKQKGTQVSNAIFWWFSEDFTPPFRFYFL